MYYDLNSEWDNRTIRIGWKIYLLWSLVEEQKQEIAQMLQSLIDIVDENDMKYAWTSVVKKILWYFNDGMVVGSMWDAEFTTMQLYINEQLGLWE